MKTAIPIAVVVFTVTLMIGKVIPAADRTIWTTGAEIQQRLSQPIDILWSGTSLRSAIESLARSQQVAILIDRRIDPGQKLNLAIKDTPMELVLQAIADQHGLGVSRLGAIVYLGPMSVARRLRPATLAFGKAVRQLPTITQRRFFQSKALAWENLATPRELLAQLGRQNGIELVGLEQVPHDLWAAADLPPASLIDRLSLIAVQFDLTFKVAAGGTRLDIVPMPDNLPEVPEQHRTASSPQMTPKPSVAAPSTSVERIRIQRLSVQSEPLGPILRKLSDRLGLELHIDEKALEAAGISLDQRVSATIENATVDELFRQLLQSTGLKAERRRKFVEIVPAD